MAATDLPPSPLKHRHCLAILFIAVFSAYAGSLNNGLVMFDDEDTNYFSRPLAGPAPIKALAERFSYNPVATMEAMVTGRHLRDISFQLDRAIFDDDPWGSHLINTVLHWAASAAAFFAFSLFLREKAWALFAALLFALHPVQTESVAYVAGRRDILYGLFFLVSFRSGAIYIRDGGKYVLTAALFTWGLSLLSKQAAVAMPLTLLLALPLLKGDTPLKDYIRGNSRARWLLIISGSAAALYSLGVVGTIIRSTILRMDAPPETYWYGGSMAAQYLTIPAVLLKAAGKLFLPANLCADYSYLSIEPSLSPFSSGFLLPLAAIAASAGVAAAAGLKRPLVLFAAGWAAVTYLPVLPLLPSHHNMEVFAEHWLYLPVFGFSLLVTAAAQELPAGATYARKGLAIAVLLFFALYSRSRSLDWKDPETLWAKTLSQQPYCLRALNNYAIIKLRSGDLAAAKRLLERALDLSPRHLPTYVNMATLELDSGNTGKAREWLKKAFSTPLIRQNVPLVVRNLGVINYREGNYREAMRNFRAAACRVRIGICDPGILTSYAQAAFAAGDLNEARKGLNKALELAPRQPEALKTLGAVLLETGEPEAARAALEKALEISPGGPDTHINLSLAYARLKDPRRALGHASAATRVAPGEYRSWLALSEALRTAGRPRKALPYARKAAYLRETPETLTELALVQRGMKDWTASLKTFEKARRLFPNDPAIAFHQAGTLWESGQELKAYSALYNLLKIYPDYRPAVNAMDFVRLELEKRGLPPLP